MSSQIFHATSTKVVGSTINIDSILKSSKSLDEINEELVALTQLNLHKILRLHFTRTALLKHFDKVKNPKLFLYFMYLYENSLIKDSSLLYTDITLDSYKYEVSERSIKNWVSELERLKLLKINRKMRAKGNLIFIEMLDWEQSEFVLSVQEQTEQSQNANVEKSEKLPNRFYKNIALIFNKVQKENAHKELVIGDDKPSNLKDYVFNAIAMNRSELSGVDSENIPTIKLASISNNRTYTKLTYEQFTNQALPNIKNYNHLKIIENNVRKSFFAMHQNYQQKVANDRFLGELRELRAVIA